MERKLRHGKAAEAVARLRALLAPFAGSDCILPERFLTVKADDLVLTGWEGLAGAIQTHDQPERPVTALSIAFGWPGEDGPAPDTEGRLAPHIEISYFTDDIFPFSQSGRDDLLDGYSYHGCTWGDDCEANDNALSLGGIDDLHGALSSLEARLLASDEPDAEEIRAGSLGACLLSALLFQAVGERIARDGLPRPLCVMAGSNGVYPYFDAPVVGISDEVRKAAEADADRTGPDRAIPAPRYSSLVMTGIPRAKKRAVLVLEEKEEEMATRFARLRGMDHAHDETSPAQREELPDVSTPFLPDASPDLPLLAKKTPRPEWDFRDMLAPREPDSQSAQPPLLKPADFPQQSGPATGGEPTVGPGFSLIEPGLHQRLQALIAPRIPEETHKTEPVLSIPDQSFEPVWLSGRSSWGDDEALLPTALRSEVPKTAARPSLWARLRERLRWRR